MQADITGSEKDISVVICTCNRAGSLKITLDCLCRNDRSGLDVQVVVVDNNSSDETRNVAESYRGRLPLRYLFEPAKGVYGKSHALNRAIDSGGLGSIVAVIDDDISPHEDWLKGVSSISGRWPDKDFFTGSTYVIWPIDDIPCWALNPVVRRRVFSAETVSRHDSLSYEGQWFLGGHFWFRSRVLSGGRRFKDVWMTEPDFMLQLTEDGFAGIMGPDAVAGHRIQPGLLSKSSACRQAVRLGRQTAEVRLRSYRGKVRSAFLFHKYPLLSRLYCIADGIRWHCVFLWSKYLSHSDEGFIRSLVALEHSSRYRQLLAIAGQMEEYSVFSRR